MTRIVCHMAFSAVIENAENTSMQAPAFYSITPPSLPLQESPLPPFHYRNHPSHPPTTRIASPSLPLHKLPLPTPHYTNCPSRPPTAESPLEGVGALEKKRFPEAGQGFDKSRHTVDCKHLFKGQLVTKKNDLKAFPGKDMATLPPERGS